MTARNADELIAMVPHLVGFHPEESLVVVPLRSSMPTARVDLPSSPAVALQTAHLLAGAYRQHAHPGAQVALVSFTERHELAAVTTDIVRDAFAAQGIGARVSLTCDRDTWTDLDTGSTGLLTAAAAGRVGAEQVARGALAPAPSREAIAEAFSIRPAQVAAVAAALADLDSTAPTTTSSTASTSEPSGDGEWVLGRLGRFQRDGQRLDDHDAARLLVALADKEHRDAVWIDMSRSNANQHAALWSDLTRRAPEQVRTPAAALAGWSHWLRGDGASAWCALDQIPPADAADYPMAQILTQALQDAVNPRTWDDAKQAITATAAAVADRDSHGDPARRAALTLAQREPAQREPAQREPAQRTPAERTSGPPVSGRVSPESRHHASPESPNTPPAR